MNSNQPLLDALVPCHNCETEVALREVVCPHCKLPLINDFKENNEFNTEDRETSHRLLEIDTKITQSRILLFFMSGFHLVGVMLPFIAKEEAQPTISIEGIIFSLVYFSLGWFVPKNPRLFLIGGLVTYLLYTFLQYLVHPASLTTRLIIKVVIIGVLFTGIHHAFWAEKIKDKLRKRI